MGLVAREGLHFFYLPTLVGFLTAVDSTAYMQDILATLKKREKISGFSNYAYQAKTQKSS